jgi:hypothetical protein
VLPLLGHARECSRGATRGATIKAMHRERATSPCLMVASAL